MPHLANLMIPTGPNGDHPLSALAFSTAIALRIANQITTERAIDYLNRVMASNGGAPLSQGAMNELGAIRSNFLGKNINDRQNYLAVLQVASLWLEDVDYNDVTAAEFDTMVEI